MRSENNKIVEEGTKEEKNWGGKIIKCGREEK